MSTQKTSMLDLNARMTAIISKGDRHITAKAGNPAWINW